LRNPICSSVEKSDFPQNRISGQNRIDFLENGFVLQLRNPIFPQNRISFLEIRFVLQLFFPKIGFLVKIEKSDFSPKSDFWSKWISFFFRIYPQQPVSMLNVNSLKETWGGEYHPHFRTTLI